MAALCLRCQEAVDLEQAGRSELFERAFASQASGTL